MSFWPCVSVPEAPDVLLAPLLGVPGRLKRCTTLLEVWQRHPEHHFLRQNRAGAGVPRKAGKQRLLQDLYDIVPCVNKLFLRNHVLIGQRLGAHGPPRHDLSWVLPHQTGWNGSLLLRLYAVFLRAERVLQLEDGLVTPDDPTQVLRRPVSQLLGRAQRPFLFCFFQRFSAFRPCGKLLAQVSAS